MNLTKLNNKTLINDLKSLVKQERKILTEILDYLKEVERRKLYLNMGYSSLFAWMTEYLGYSEGAAQRRIQAMRLVRAHPEVEVKISSGRISLSVASNIQSYLKREEKKRKETKSKELTKTNKLELITQLEGTSSRKCEEILATISPETALPKEKTRPITDEKTQISFIANKSLIQKIKRLKTLTSHQNPEGTYEKLFEKALDIALEKLDPIKRQERRDLRQKKSRLHRDPATTAKHKKISQKLPTPLAGGLKSPPSQGAKRNQQPNHAPNIPPTSAVKRYIPKKLQDQIWVRDKGKCQYLDIRTGKKCHSKHLIEVDHKNPFSWGGEHSIRNLRLYCRGHNLYRSGYSGFQDK